MIHAAVEHIVTELNAYVNLRTGVTDRVVHENLLEQSGSEVPAVDDKMVLSVVNIEEDRVFQTVEPYERQDDGTYHKIRPEVRVNLFLLFIANLSDYKEALKALAHVIGFFQKKPSFDYAEIPVFAGLTGKLVFELQSLTFEEVNHLWGALGAKYRPSVLYKMRVTLVRDEQVEATLPPVEEIHIVDP